MMGLKRTYGRLLAEQVVCIGRMFFTLAIVCGLAAASPAWAGAESMPDSSADDALFFDAIYVASGVLTDFPKTTATSSASG